MTTPPSDSVLPGDPPSSSPAAEPLAQLTGEVNDLQTAVRDLTRDMAETKARLEEDRTSFMRRFSLVGGVVALALSLVSGSYALLDTFAFKPREEMRRLQDELRRVGDDLAKLHETYVTQVLSLQDPMARSYGASILDTRRQILLQKAEQLIESLGEDSGLAELLLVANQELEVGNATAAKAMFDRAMRKKPNEQIRASVHLLYGDFYFRPGPTQDKSEARNQFAQAVRILEVRDDPLLLFKRGMANGRWGYSEMMFGDAERGRQLLQTGIAQLRQVQQFYPDAAPAVGMFQQALAGQLASPPVGMPAANIAVPR